MRAAGILTCVVLLSVPLAAAQAPLAVAPVTMTHGSNATTLGSAGTAVPLSATEAAFHMAQLALRLDVESHAPSDSQRVVRSAGAQQWLQQLQTSAVSGIQLDPYGTLQVTAGHDTLAQQTIAARLATPGLSAADRAYTDFTAVTAFASVDVPARLPVAEHYLTALDALGPAAALPQFVAHKQLAGIYYLLGRSSDMLRHGLRAVAVLPDVELVDRSAMFFDPQFYSELVGVLSGQPNAPARIATLNAALLAAATPSAAVVARDAGADGRGKRYQSSLHEMIVVGTRIGTPAQPVEGNFWVNLSAPGSVSGPHTIPVADGTIRILEMGHYNCGQCIAALGPLQRIQDQYPRSQVLYATATEGSWSNRVVEPDEEVPHLVEFYTQKLKIRFPISIWKEPLAPTEDGGRLPKTSGPNFDHYPLAFKPNIYVIDGRGIIRGVFIGVITPAREAQMTALVGLLEHESAAPAPRAPGARTAP